MTASTATADAASPLIRIRTDLPCSARIWNYWMGGKDCCGVDQVARDAPITVYPAITTHISTDTGHEG